MNMKMCDVGSGSYTVVGTGTGIHVLLDVLVTRNTLSLTRAAIPFMSCEHDVRRPHVLMRRDDRNGIHRSYYDSPMNCQ